MENKLYDLDKEVKSMKDKFGGLLIVLLLLSVVFIFINYNQDREIKVLRTELTKIKLEVNVWKLK